MRQESNELQENEWLLQRRQETQMCSEQVCQMLKQGQKVPVKLEMLLEQVQEWPLQVVLPVAAILLTMKHIIQENGQTCIQWVVSLTLDHRQVVMYTLFIVDNRKMNVI